MPLLGSSDCWHGRASLFKIDSGLQVSSVNRLDAKPTAWAVWHKHDLGWQHISQRSSRLLLASVEDVELSLPASAADIYQLSVAYTGLSFSASVADTEVALPASVVDSELSW